MAFEKPSRQIQNKVIVIFLFSIVLLLFFGSKVFLDTLAIGQTITLAKGDANGLDASQVSIFLGEITRLTSFSILYIAVAFSILVGLMFNLVYSVSPSLKRLAYAVQQINVGNYGFRLKLQGRNELGDIAETLNTALDRVFLEEQQLRDQKEHVEQIVVQRTKELVAERTKFLLSIKSLPVGFMLVNSNGTINLINPVMGSFLNFKGLDFEEFKKNLDIVVNFIQTLTSHVPEVIKSKKNLDMKYTTETGRHLKIAYSPLLSLSEDSEGVVIVAEDVTDQVNLEHTKDEFMTIASHELRTPLAAIKGNAELMRALYKNQMEDVQFKKIVTGIETSSTRLSGIVNELLEAAKIEQGGITIKPENYDVASSVLFVSSDLVTVAAEKNLYLKFDQEKFNSAPQIYAEPRRVEQILYNLIGNGFKFTETGGVTIDFKVVDGFLELLVADSGKGIPEDKKQLLFKKFGQLDTDPLMRDQTPSTGLGLYISKKLAETMGGTIFLEKSEVGFGTVFGVKLPLASNNKKLS